MDVYFATHSFWTPMKFVQVGQKSFTELLRNKLHFNFKYTVSLITPCNQQYYWLPISIFLLLSHHLLRTKHGLTVQLGNPVLSWEAHVMKENRGVDVEFHLFLTLAWNVGMITPTTPCKVYLHRKRPQCPLHGGGGGGQCRSGGFGGEISTLTLPGIETRILGLPACRFVTIPTELSRFPQQEMYNAAI
jgi:hypothetical protein